MWSKWAQARTGGSTVTTGPGDRWPKAPQRRAAGRGEKRVRGRRGAVCKSGYTLVFGECKANYRM